MSSGELSKSESDTFSPLVEGNENAGAEVPRGSIFEGVNAMILPVLCT